MNQPISSRRKLLQSAACGFGALAFNGIAQAQSQPANRLPEHPQADRTTPILAKAKRIIFVFMQGGPSQVDTFDPKVELQRNHNEPVEFLVARTRQRTKQKLFKSPWKFKQYGECGQPVSELFPHMANCVDDFCLVKSMHTEGVAHGPATLFLHTGATNLIRPSVGAWVTYGLGTENQNLPAFVTINPPPTKGGPRNYGNAFLPANYQAMVIGKQGSGGGIKNLSNQQMSKRDQRLRFDYLQELNRAQIQNHSDQPSIANGSGGNDPLNATLRSFELAFKMQQAAPEVIDINREPEHIKSMYGIGEEKTDEFGRQCLLARRFAEAGVRYIQVSYSDLKSTPRWDQHSNLKNHEVHAKATDKPVAGLLQDLKQRGLLEDTIVWWGGEFGRTPYSQNNDGRDHNPNGFSIWLAGGGVKSGMAYGETDEFGFNAVQNKVHMHDLHATLLHLLGINHKQLTYRYAGRDFRLTDVYGRVIHDLIA